MVIGIRTLKQYDYTTIEMYFDYIIESQINGNHKQVKELHDKLSREQKKYFWSYLKQNEIKFDYSGVL